MGSHTARQNVSPSSREFFFGEISAGLGIAWSRHESMRPLEPAASRSRRGTAHGLRDRRDLSVRGAFRRNRHALDGKRRACPSKGLSTGRDDVVCAATVSRWKTLHCSCSLRASRTVSRPRARSGPGVPHRDHVIGR